MESARRIRLTSTSRTTWRRLGTEFVVVVVGILAALAVPDVVSRFGPVGLHAHRLANGVDERPVNTVVHEAALAVEMAVDEPIHEASAVVFAARERADRPDGEST